jgi:ribosomal protein S18 acetylase RimI-like enzyme
MRVRGANLPDAERIAEIHIAAWRAGYGELMPKAYLDSLDVRERALRWRKVLSGALTTMTILCVDESDETLGFCQFGLCRDYDVRATPTGEIIALNVDPIAWGRGCARLLVDAALADAGRIGWRTVKLWVLRDNPRARAFYDRYGFVPDGAEKTDTQLTSTPLHQVRYTIGVRT